jgi:hypothetical protein
MVSSDRAKAKKYRYYWERGITGFTDAAPVVAHLRYLHRECGVLLSHISRETGVTYYKVRGIQGQYGGKYRKVRKEDAAALMAYQPPSSRIPPGPERVVGAKRILRGLACAGFTSKVLAEMVGRATHTMDNWRMGYQHIDPEIYQRIVAVGQKLEGVKPEDMGIKPSTASQVRSRAKTIGYIPLGYWDWDTIHRPDAFPDLTGSCGTPSGATAHTRQGIPVCEPCRAARREHRKGDGDGRDVG